MKGELNHFGEYGYNRKGKKEQKQLVIGMLCDESGEPVSAQETKTGDPDTDKGRVRYAQDRER